jgi:hypothetical protein
MPKKNRSQPHKAGYKGERSYPTERVQFSPEHGIGPRCRVLYEPNRGGTFAVLSILNVDGDNEETIPAIIPRYYAIPLILINKYLAFIEAHFDPEGRPLNHFCLKLQDTREYAYLWRLREVFLQEIVYFNTSRDFRSSGLLDPNWQFDKIHGFLHRMYKRFRHDNRGRYLYWRQECSENRVPYTTPDIKDMGEFPQIVTVPPPSAFL